MSRRQELMRAAAAAFADGRVPDHAFLVENSVTLDECGDLLDDLARAVRVYLSIPKDDRLEMDARDAAQEAIPGPDGEALGRFIAAGLRMNRLTRQLREAP